MAGLIYVDYSLWCLQLCFFWPTDYHFVILIQMIIEFLICLELSGFKNELKHSLSHVMVCAFPLSGLGFLIAPTSHIPKFFKWKFHAIVQYIYNYHSCRVTFLVAEACLIAGASKNAYHTKYREMIYAQNLSCESLRKGVFIAGAVFVVATMILNVYYYMYFNKATTTPASHKANRVSSTVGMAGYA